MIENQIEVACFGEPLVGFYGEEKTGVDAIPFKMVIGGDTSNVALALTKLGHRATYITRLGDDFFGEYIKRTWQEADVDTKYVLIDNERTTGVYFALFNKNGQHRFAYKRKNSAAASFGTLEAEQVSLEGIKVFHTSGITQAISKKTLEASFYFMEKCKRKGIKVTYDLNYRHALWSKEYFSSIAWYTINHYADVVTLNLQEAEYLGLKGEPEDIVQAIIQHGPGIAALKLGERGSIIGSADSIYYGRPFQIKVADTVGAGDAFTAATIAGILEGMEVKEIPLFANAVAAMVCQAVGSTNGQPTRGEVKRFLEEHL